MARDKIFSRQATDHSEEFYRESFVSSPLPQIVLDHSGNCCLANQAFKMTFFEDPELECEQDLSLVEKIFLEPGALHSLIDEVLEKDVIRRRKMTLSDCNDHMKEILVFARRVVFQEADAIEFSMMECLNPASHRRDSNWECGQTRLLLDNLDIGLFMVDKQGTIVEINQQVSNLLGPDLKINKGRQYRELFSSLLGMVREPAVLQHRLDYSLKAVNQRPVVELALDEEPVRELDMILFPVWDSSAGLCGWGGMIQDVSEARQQMESKTELLTVLSHDLRIPLATLKGQATALLANFPYWSQAMNTDFLEGINRITDQLIHQVERSLALTRVESSHLGIRPESCSFINILDQALDRMSEALRKHEIRIDLPDSLPDVRVDPERIEEILINLMDNVVRFSSSAKEIRIEGELDEMVLWISITDHGPVIPIDEHKVIFDKSIRTARASGGRGQGLYICRKIVEAHGGTIKVLSPLEGINHGTRVSFSLPLTPEKHIDTDEQPQNQIENLETAGENLRVLVISAEPDSQELFHSILVNNGYLMESASGGMDAVDLVHDSQPDMIVMDWSLPGISGLSLCRNLRRWTDAPILVVTDQINQRDLVAALDAGADDYIARPFDTQVLLARLNALARRRNQRTKDDPDRITIGNLTIDFELLEVWRSGEKLHLTPSEFNLLAVLARHPGQILTYDQLMDHVYDRGENRNRHTLFVHVSRLRKKIESDPDEPALLRTKWGVGYVLSGI